MQLHRDVLERQRRPVEQLQHELVRRRSASAARRPDGGTWHRPRCHPASSFFGNLAGDERPDDLDRDLPIGAAEQSRRSSRATAAARFPARKGRRRGRARPASRRRSRERGPRPASKCSASTDPPKAADVRPAFDDVGVDAPRRRNRAHHNAFYREGEIAVEIGEIFGGSVWAASAMPPVNALKEESYDQADALTSNRLGQTWHIRQCHQCGFCEMIALKQRDARRAQNCQSRIRSRRLRQGL